MKTVLLGLIVLGLTYPTVTFADISNPCYVEKTITKTKDEFGDEIVSEESKTVCSDKHAHFLQDAGIAKSCEEFEYYVNLRNTPVARRGYACQKFDGTWEIVRNPYTDNK